MKLKCYCFHKSGSMFLYRLFKKIAEDNNIDYFSVNNKPSNHTMFRKNITKYILCPLRGIPGNYDPDIKYIIHIRNPLDILISQYYSFGFTHRIPDKNSINYENFIERREKIQNMTIDKYCLSDEIINEINYKYNHLLDWVDQYKNFKNVFISNYDDMYYNFPNWLNDIFKFMSLNTYDKTLSVFEKEFDNKHKVHCVIDIKNNKNHRRSGLSKQYLVELNQNTINLIINKFSDRIRYYFNLK